MTALAPEDVARQLNAYARQYNAGAFGAPTRKDLEEHPSVIHTWDDGSIGIVRQIRTASRRRDFTGALINIPKYAVVTDHLLLGDSPPDLGFTDYVSGYVEDSFFVQHVESQGFNRHSTRISASSEIIGLWWRGEAQWPATYDISTVAEVVCPFTQRQISDIASQMQEMRGWHDDFPYYSDGSWSALNLRGYRPDDPRWGIKPSEMPRKWKEEHPEALKYRCGWTVLSDSLPLLKDRVQTTWPHLERVRLLQMQARQGGARLARHTDITDKAQGTRDGQIARFHIPLITDPAVTMTTWNLSGIARTLHLQTGHCYYLDARKPHAVENMSSINRIHLVVDVIVDESIRSLIARATQLS